MDEPAHTKASMLSSQGAFNPGSGSSLMFSLCCVAVPNYIVITYWRQSWRDCGEGLWGEQRGGLDCCCSVMMVNRLCLTSRKCALMERKAGRSTSFSGFSENVSNVFGCGRRGVIAKIRCQFVSFGIFSCSHRNGSLCWTVSELCKWNLLGQ